MRQYFTLFSICIALVSGLVVFQVKSTVQERRDDVEKLARQIEADQRAIKMLRTEWAYLTSPSRLQDQSMHFLAMGETSARQIIRDVQQVPYRVDLEAPVDAPESIVIPLRYAPIPTPKEKPDRRLGGYQRASLIIRVDERSGR